MQDIEKIAAEVRAVLDRPATSFRSAYEAQNAVHAQLERLDDADKRAAPFNGGRSDEVKQTLRQLRAECSAKLQQASAGAARKSPANKGGARSPSAMALAPPAAAAMAGAIPGSEEWLKQLQAEDEVDMEHERRASKHRHGRGAPKGGRRPAGGQNSGHGGGHAAGELPTQREHKNAEKQLGPMDERLQNLVHPASVTNLDLADADDGNADAAASSPDDNNNINVSNGAPGREIRHETHRDCHFSVVSAALLARSATVRCVEGQPLVEITFQPERRRIVVDPVASPAAVSPAIASGQFGSVAAQFGYITGSASSRHTSRRGTPTSTNRKSPAAAASGGRSPGRRNETPGKKRGGMTPESQFLNPNFAVPEQQQLVDCETRITMYRTVFDALWALADTTDAARLRESLPSAGAAEHVAKQIPVPIGGSGAAAAGRRLGGVASKEDEDAVRAQQEQRKHEREHERDTGAPPAMTMHRSSTREYLASPGPGLNDGLSFPSLNSSEMALAAAGAQSSASPMTLLANTADERPGPLVPAAAAARSASSSNLAGSGAGAGDDSGDDNDEEETGDDDDDVTEEDRAADLKRLQAILARENAGKGGDDDGDDGEGGYDDTAADFADLDVNQGVMTQTPQLDVSASSQRLAFLSKVTVAPWTVILVHGGYFAAAVYVQGVPIIHKAFHRYVVRRKQGGKQSNQEGIAGSAGSQIRKAQEKKFGEDVQVLLDAWRHLIDASWFVFFAAPSPSNRKLLVTFTPSIVRAAVQEKPQLHAAASDVSSKNSVVRLRPSNPDQSPLSFADPRVKSVPMTTKRPVFGEVQRVYETLSRCTVRLFYRETADGAAEVDDDE